MSNFAAFSEPFSLFHSWLADAETEGLTYPNAATLATATLSGKPSARIVLFRKVDEQGFVFYTNLASRKGQELKENPQAALCFYWMSLEKQVRIEGKTISVSQKEADDYFAARPRGSQLGAWASRQSAVMESPEELPARLETITETYESMVIPRPPFWSGFRLVPEYFEFWQEAPFRLHTRITYSKEGDKWRTDRLFP